VSTQGHPSPALQAWRIGALVLAGVAVLAAALVASGLRGWSERERARMHFHTSVWGLQVGAPVVLRGVRVGEVSAIGLPAPGARALPVVATLDTGQLRTLLAAPAQGPTLPALVEQGLVARLATQSLLTGLLYVDLDFDVSAAASSGQAPAPAVTRPPSARTHAEPVEIPTAVSRLQALQAQLEGLDLARIGRDLAEVSAGLRQMLAEPEARQALRRTAERAGAGVNLLKAVEQVNVAQKQVLFARIRDFFDGQLADRVVTVWGLAFKPNTDDMREAPSRVLMEALWKAGARVRAYDPVAMNEARRLYPAVLESGALTLCESAYAALEGAAALCVVTEWQEFRSPDFDLLKSRLSTAVIFDGRNLYDPALMRRLGIRYFGIGRGESVRVAEEH